MLASCVAFEVKPHRSSSRIGKNSGLYGKADHFRSVLYSKTGHEYLPEMKDEMVACSNDTCRWESEAPKMTADEFRNLALSLPATSEEEHMGHPDFRVHGKIFATLGPGEAWGMAKLTPEQQATFVRTEPKVFQPIKGAWGRRGCTQVCLEAASEPSVRQALIAAWRKHGAQEPGRAARCIGSVGWSSPTNRLGNGGQCPPYNSWLE